MNTKRKKRSCAWKWLAVLVVLSVIAGAGCQSDNSHLFADKTPIRIIINDKQGRPQPDVQLNEVEMISCAYSNCVGKMDGRIFVSGNSGLLRADVPFPGTFKLHLFRQSDSKRFTRKINVTRSEQIVKVVL